MSDTTTNLADESADTYTVLDEVTVTASFNLPILIGIGVLLAWGILSDADNHTGDL